MSEEVKTEDRVRPFVNFMHRCQSALPRYHRITPDEQLRALHYILAKKQERIPDEDLDVKAEVIECIREMRGIMAQFRVKSPVADIEAGAYLFANACQCWNDWTENSAEVMRQAS